MRKEAIGRGKVATSEMGAVRRETDEQKHLIGALGMIDWCALGARQG